MYNLSNSSTITPCRFSVFLYIVQTSSKLFLSSLKKKEREGGGWGEWYYDVLNSLDSVIYFPFPTNEQTILHSL